MSLLRTNREQILSCWEAQVRALPPFQGLDVTHLRDHVPELLDELDSWIEESARRTDRPTEKRLPAASEHAEQRLDLGFDLRTLVYEYRLLRRAVFATCGVPRGREEELVAVNDAIDQAIAESVSRHAEEARGRMEETRDRLIGIVSHDLRNPLAGIVSGASAMLRAGDLGERHTQTLQRVLRAANRMARVVANALDFTRARLGASFALARAPTDLARICRDALEEVELGGPVRPIDFQSSGDVRGEWDEDRIARVVHNLLSNALKFSLSAVHLRLRGEEREVVLEVANDGAPMLEEAQGAVFEPLWTSDPQAGLGLGLYIVAQIVAAHGGTVGVRSVSGEGTTFTVRLPRTGPRSA